LHKLFPGNLRDPRISPVAGTEEEDA